MARRRFLVLCATPLRFLVISEACFLRKGGCSSVVRRGSRRCNRGFLPRSQRFREKKTENSIKPKKKKKN